MSEWNIGTINVEWLYTQSGFTATQRDYYEYTESALVTFLDRLHDAIEADATISNWLDECVVVAIRDLSRFNIGAYMDKNLVILHSPRQEPDTERGGPMRRNVLMHCMVTCVGRSGKGLDSEGKEIPLVGDGTATQPSVLEMQSDIETLLDRNDLPSGGVDYIWQMDIGVSELDDDLFGTEHGEIMSATREITGHRWEHYA